MARYEHEGILALHGSAITCLLAGFSRSICVFVDPGFLSMGLVFSDASGDLGE